MLNNIVIKNQLSKAVLCVFYHCLITIFISESMDSYYFARNIYVLRILS